MRLRSWIAIALMAPISFILVSFAWAKPSGKWANLKRFPGCTVAFNFRSNGTAELPDIRNPQKKIIASWRMQNNTIIITEANKKWVSYYSYRNDKIVWLSVKALGKTQSVTNQYSLSDRTLTPCS